MKAMEAIVTYVAAVETRWMLEGSLGARRDLFSIFITSRHFLKPAGDDDK